MMKSNKSNYMQDKNNNLCDPNCIYFELHPEEKPEEKKKKYVYNKYTIFHKNDTTKKHK